MVKLVMLLPIGLHWLGGLSTGTASGSMPSHWLGEILPAAAFAEGVPVVMPTTLASPKLKVRLATTRTASMLPLLSRSRNVMVGSESLIPRQPVGPEEYR